MCSTADNKMKMFMRFVPPRGQFMLYRCKVRLIRQFIHRFWDSGGR